MAELNFNALATTGPRGFYQGFEQGVQERNQLAQQQMKQQADAQQQQFNAMKMQGYQEDRAKQSRAEKAALFRESILRAPDPNTAREIIKRQYNDPDLGPLLQQTIPLDAALSEISDDVVQFREYQKREALGVEGYAKSQLPKVAGNAVYDPSTNSFITAPREPAPVAPSAPVAVMGADGRPQYVSREQAIGMTPFTAPAIKFMGGGAGGSGTRAAPAAPAPKPMTELQQQSQRKLMAADKTSVKASQSVVGELEKLTDELVGNPEKGIRPDPGLSGITGFQALIPSMPKSDARKAQQKLETMKGKVMAFGRQLASLEGKLGNMAVQEWKFVSDSIQALDPAAGNLDVQLRDIVRQAKNFANTVQERYDLTYEGGEEMPSAAPSRPSAPAPAVGAGGGLSPAEQAELDQLRARFGKK